VNLTAWRWRIEPGSAIAEVETQRGDAFAPVARPMTTNAATTERRDKNGRNDAARSHQGDCDKSETDAHEIRLTMRLSDAGLQRH
jgi:hypothetical protein